MVTTSRGLGRTTVNDWIGWGRWSALVCGLGAVCYGLAGVLVGAFAASAITWETFDQFIAGYRPLPTLLLLFPSFVVAVVFPVLVVAVYSMVREERRPFGLAALMFAGVYTAVLGADYWLQVTNVPWNIIRETTDGLAPWVLWNPASFFWSFEAFGYFAMGIACVFVGLAYQPGELPRRLRGGLLAMGPLGVFFLTTSLKDVLLNPADPAPAWVTVWSLSAALAWVVLFGFVSLSLARWFARMQTTVPLPPDSIPATTTKAAA